MVQNTLRNTASPMQTRLGSVAISALLLAVPAHAQDPELDSIRALGAFDQIAQQCARGGSDAEIDSFRQKLWRAYLIGQGAADTSPQAIHDVITRLRSQVVDDVTDELRRQYKSARDTIPDVAGLGRQQQHEFYELCESPRIRGAPGSP